MKKLEKKTKELLRQAKQYEELKKHEKLDNALLKLSVEELRELLDESTTEDRYDEILKKAGIL